MNRLFKVAALVGAFFAGIATADACTNFIVTRGASTDGSNMVTYAADSHGLYGSLYQYIPGKFTEWMDVTEWDTGRYIGKIKQAPVTYRTLGNSNEHSLFITETTFGGRPELEDPKGGIDYGSLIYITLQRAKTAREAIDIIVELANTYGYCSSGESFSLIDKQEAWIIKHYKHTKNSDILNKFGIGESTLHRFARKHGLKKSKQFLKKMQRENAERGYAVCLQYGVYEQSAEYAREQWRLRKERGETLGFKKGESNKTRMSPQRFKKVMQLAHETRRETIRKERMRIRWGFDQKTKMRLVSGGKDRIHQRYAMRKRGYIVPRGSNIVYYTDDTMRDIRAEERARATGLHVELWQTDEDDTFDSKK